ncbi:hypothetical protein [Nonomuraea sp. NPDC050691]|uniref:hypothetical protein n=1 Tax=Nonomuraea sp. NPDC050691 TaxID=3155661 RepID=UPI0033FC5FA0
MTADRRGPAGPVSPPAGAGVEHDDHVVGGGACPAGRRPVVRCTGRPTRVRLVRWRAVSAATLLIPGDDLVREGDVPPPEGLLDDGRRAVVHACLTSLLSTMGKTSVSAMALTAWG